MLLEEATFPGVHMRCRVIGAFALQVGDIAETKLIVVPETDHHADHLHDLGDLPPAFLDELDVASGDGSVLVHEDGPTITTYMPVLP